VTDEESQTKLDKKTSVCALRAITGLREDDLSEWMCMLLLWLLLVLQGATSGR